MSLAFISYIQQGFELAFSSFKPLFYILAISALILLETAGFTLPLGAIIVCGAFVVAAAAGYATYGILGVAVVFLGFIITAILYALMQR